MQSKPRDRCLAVVLSLALGAALGAALPVVAADEGEAGGGQDAETKALDSTATQRSFQLAYQWLDSKTDTPDGGC